VGVAPSEAVLPDRIGFCAEKAHQIDELREQWLAISELLVEGARKDRVYYLCCFGRKAALHPPGWSTSARTYESFQDDAAAAAEQELF
jgi:hypothetical protein